MPWCRLYCGYFYNLYDGSEMELSSLVFRVSEMGIKEKEEQKKQFEDAESLPHRILHNRIPRNTRSCI